MLEAGTQAPDFTLPDQDGAPVSLSDLRGAPAVVYFYPKADTPGYVCGGSGGVSVGAIEHRQVSWLDDRPALSPLP